MIAQWSDRYSVSVDKFDDQHKKLFDIINKLEDISKQGKPNTEAAEVAKELRDYTVLHFNAEERVMQTHNYPDIDAQREEHEKFREVTRDLYSDLILDKKIDYDEKLGFLANWLIHHIGDMDMGYARYFKEKGIDVVA